MRVAVAGATGFVGRHVTRRLLDVGHDVRALVRTPEKAADVLPEEAEIVPGDVFDEAAVAGLVDGAEAIVNCIGIRREVAPNVTFERLHPRATERLLDAARTADCERYVQISALGVRPNAPTAYHRSKYIAETLVRRSGLAWTILRPSLVHGVDGELMRMIKAWALGRAAPWIMMPWFARVELRDYQEAVPIDKLPVRVPEPPVPVKLPTLASAALEPVAVADVAGAVSNALASRRSIGEVYPLTGPEEIRWPELLRLVRDNLGIGDGRPIVPLPGRIGWAMALAARPLGLAEAIDFGPSEPIMAMEDSTSEKHKAHAHLGFDPGPFRSAVEAYAPSI